jgi:tRNA-specific 2-thiouridylase
VVAIHPDRREVVIGTATDLEGHRVRLEELNWLADPLAVGEACEVQIRYRAHAVPATVLAIEDAALDLALALPVRAIAPGQSGVLYGERGRVLGGGVIAG